MDNSHVVRQLTLVAQQMLLGFDEILEAIALLEGLPAARCNAEGNAPLKVEGILYLLHVRLARAERAAQHILPSAAHSCRPR